MKQGLWLSTEPSSTAMIDGQAEIVTLAVKDDIRWLKTDILVNKKKVALEVSNHFLFWEKEKRLVQMRLRKLIYKVTAQINNSQLLDLHAVCMSY